MSAMLWLWLWVLCYVMRGGDDGRGHTRVGARTESPTPSLIRLLYIRICKSVTFSSQNENICRSSAL